MVRVYYYRAYLLDVIGNGGVGNITSVKALRYRPRDLVGEFPHDIKKRSFLKLKKIALSLFGIMKWNLKQC